MTPERIRELAVERMGAVIAEHDKVLQYGTDFDSCQCGWCGHEKDWGAHVAEEAADALGDLLPTGTQERHLVTTWKPRKGTSGLNFPQDFEPCGDPVDQVRFVADWRPVDA